MLTAQAIEDKILLAIQDDFGAVESVVFTGSWTPRMETPDASAAVTVAVSTPSVPTYTAPQQTYSATIAIGVRMECDADGSLFLALADAVSSLLSRWQGETYQQCFAALDIDGVLSIDEISVEAATPAIDRETGYHTLVFPITLYATTSTQGE